MINDKRRSKNVTKGQKLLYIPKHGPIEEGEYSSHNDTYIFIKFSTGANGQACKYENVNFIFNNNKPNN